MSDVKNIFEKNSENQPKCHFPRPLMDERGKKMELDPKEIQGQQTFDSFCKKVLKHEAANGHREINRRALIEIPMSELPEGAMEQLAVYDAYPWEYTSFQVGNETVLVKDDRLAEAPVAIPEKGRNIILMYIGSWIWQTVRSLPTWE